ncbi:DUF3127 domain-containing protein, partial [Arthrospira platensis SPKY1]|nr:DUF3127 domain-containing protein [Arthrospira platensis SPKY1]
QTQAVTETFKKREFIIVTDEQYPQYIQLEFTQDKCDLLDKYAKGQKVTVNVNLRGRLWTDPKTNIEKAFNTIQAWKITADSNAPEPQVTQPETEVEDGDLPF